MAPPPIQLPATVVNPRQTASGPAPPTRSGAKNAVIRIARGPPRIIPAVAVKNDAALSKANDNVKTNSTETDYLNPEKHSPVRKRSDDNSNVTIVGTDHHAKKTNDTKRGWWQKLAD